MADLGSEHSEQNQHSSQSPGSPENGILIRFKFINYPNKTSNCD